MVKDIIILVVGACAVVLSDVLSNMYAYKQMADPDFLSDKKKKSSAEEQNAGDESEKEVDMKE